jgi:hypothetical protein
MPLTVPVKVTAFRIGLFNCVHCKIVFILFPSVKSAVLATVLSVSFLLAQIISSASIRVMVNECLNLWFAN